MSTYSSECLEGRFCDFALKLSEKGSEGDSEGGSGQHKVGQTGRKRSSRRSMGPRHGHLHAFSDSFLTEFSEVRSLLAPQNTLCEGCAPPLHSLMLYSLLNEETLGKSQGDGWICALW